MAHSRNKHSTYMLQSNRESDDSLKKINAKFNYTATSSRPDSVSKASAIGAMGAKRAWAQIATSYAMSFIDNSAIRWRQLKVWALHSSQMDQATRTTDHE